MHPAPTTRLVFRTWRDDDLPLARALFGDSRVTALVGGPFVLGAASLFAGHHPSNEGSRRTLEQLGFRFTHHELYPPTGLMHPGYERLGPLR